MRALLYDVGSTRRWAARQLGGRVPPLAVPLAGLRLTEVELPDPPGPDWVRVRVRLCGICGSDVATLRGRTGPELSALRSAPTVPGHEIVGVAQRGPLVGRRVVVDPYLGCAVRGLPLCPACAAGRISLCHRFADGDFSPGMTLGLCRDLPGGWAPLVVAHSSQLHPVPDAVSDSAAVLAEPLAVALHAVLADPPGPEERVLLIGAGTMGLCVLAAMRMLDIPTRVAVVARHPIQRTMALKLGAVELAKSIRDAEQIATRSLGWSVWRGRSGSRVYAGGFDRVMDTVGTPVTMATAFRLARAGGRIALIGQSGAMPRFHATPMWAHELTWRGYCGYGPEPGAGGAHTMDLALRLLAERPDIPVGEFVTHSFALDDHREALRHAFFHGRRDSVKVVFEPAVGEPAPARP